MLDWMEISADVSKAFELFISLHFLSLSFVLFVFRFPYRFRLNFFFLSSWWFS